MKPALLFLLLLLSTGLSAQTGLRFDKRFVESEDHWVAFEPGADSSLSYGFIYIDPQAGLSLKYEGNFRISPTGKFIPNKYDKAGVTMRLEPNNRLVAFIPDSRLAELKVEKVPEWLQYYKTDTGSVARLYHWGFLYNGWNECAKALTYLERAAQINPRFEGLAVERAFSYNCLERYEAAENILADEIKAHADNAYVVKEYIYTLTKAGKIDEAVRQFGVAEKLKDRQYNAENCYNILQYYFKQRDKRGFNQWYSRLQQLPNTNARLTQYADRMKQDMDQ